MKIGGGMVFYMHGVLDEEVVGWTSSLALKVTPSHYWILAHFLCQQFGFIVFYGFSFLFMLSKTRQKWKVFLPNRTHIISVQKFGNLGFDDFEPLKFSSVQIFKNVHCILISKRPSKFSCEDSFLYEKLSFSEAPALVTIPGWGCHDRVFVASAKWDKMWRCIDLPHFLRSRIFHEDWFPNAVVQDVVGVGMVAYIGVGVDGLSGICCSLSHGPQCVCSICATILLRLFSVESSV
jgi:hypothetical protein